MPHTRCTLPGLLLLVRCGLYIIFSLGHTKRSLLAIIIAFAAILAWLSVKVYTKFYANATEAFLYLNLIVLSAAALGDVNSPALVNSLVGIVFVVTLGIIAYNFHCIYIAKSKVWLKILAKLTAFVATIRNRTKTEATPLLTPVANTPTKSVITLY